MSKEQINLGTRQYLNNLSEIPNAPFLYEPASKFVTDNLKALGIHNVGLEKAKTAKLGFCSDELGIYVKIKNGNPKNKIVITTHLDHPFFVIDKDGYGEAVGSVEPNRIKENTPLRIYSRNGEFLGIDVIRELKKYGPRYSIKTKGMVVPDTNSHGIWDLKPIMYESFVLKMVSADDVATTAIVLSLIEDLARTYNQVMDVEFIFTHLEEVKQVSATGIALRGRSPFDRIDESTIIIPLECDHTEASDKQAQKIIKGGFTPANYDSGLIIRLNDGKIVYGQRFDDNNNAESLLLWSLDGKENIPFQQSVVTGSCDGTSFSLFSPTPHIASITIPTKFKHNIGPGGEITHEEIKQEDLQNAKNLLERAIVLAGRTSVKPTGTEISQRLKRSQLSATQSDLALLNADRLGAYRSSIERLKVAKYYPTNNSERIYFIMGGANARIRRLLK